MPTDRTFTGETRDAGSGLVYLSARYYDPLLGRFTQPDTVVPDPGDPQEWNRYSYATNNPLRYTDPSGHFGIAGALIGAAVGAVASYGAQVVTNVRDEGFSSQAFTDVDLGQVGRAAVVGAVGGATGGAALFAGGGTLLGTAAAGAGAGAAAGQAERATSNLLEGRPVTEGLLQPTDLLGDAALGGATAGIGGALRSARGAADDVTGAPSRQACAGNSFTPDTPVLLADGTTTPISQVTVGDLVLATDPTTGQSVARPVTDLIVGTGLKHLVTVTLADGSGFTATGGHPVWTVHDSAWTDAADLTTGDQVLTHTGQPVTITGTAHTTTPATVHNLTVAVTHTYHAGTNGILVHNCTEPSQPDRRPVVVGETMARVRSAAEHFEADVFKPTGRNPTNYRRNNEEWINRQMREGRRIIDIGIDPRRVRRSEYYELEQRQLRRRQYHQVRRVDWESLMRRTR